MKKQIKHVFGKDIYLLGKDHAGINHWLEAPSWDCGWYWGFGYVETYTNNTNPEKSKDVRTHNHFSRFLESRGSSFNEFKNFFKETPLSDEEIWELLDYMSTFYSLRRTAEIYHSGNSNFTSRSKIDSLKNQEREDEINKVLLPDIFERVKILFTSN